MELGRVGIWSSPLRRGDPAEARDAAAEIEALGFRTAWMPGGESGMETRIAELLGATNKLVIALGIVNIWFHPPSEAAHAYAAATESSPGRLLVGVGIGHAPLVNQVMPGRYERPVESLIAYLEELDRATPQPVPKQSRIIGALGPQMMRLARDRTAGAHPYLVTPEHTSWARQVLGDKALLAPEQHAILDRNPESARATAREYMATYLALPHYMANFRRMGFVDADLAGGGSDRLIDSLVAWGDVDQIVRRIDQHIEAGADHVCLQFLVPGRRGFSIADWRTVAAQVSGRN